MRFAAESRGGENMGAAAVDPLEIHAGVFPFEPWEENGFSLVFWLAALCGPSSRHAGDGGAVDARVARASRPSFIIPKRRKFDVFEQQLVRWKMCVIWCDRDNNIMIAKRRKNRINRTTSTIERQQSGKPRQQ
jgi:hypothetical protein